MSQIMYTAVIATSICIATTCFAQNDTNTTQADNLQAPAAQTSQPAQLDQLGQQAISGEVGQLDQLGQQATPRGESTPRGSSTERLERGASISGVDVVKGTVKEIASDKTFILVDTTKIFTTKEFLEDSYLEVGDKIEVSVEKNDQGLRAKSYNYIFEEEALPMDSEEGSSSDEAPAPAEK